ncbi:retrovirus-related pol polyprotein from transposon TNT 1-94 [Tanacetum coccineum]
MNLQTSSVPQAIPQVAYQSPPAPTQPMTESPFVDSSFAVPVFSPRDEPIACLNKAMAFLTIVASSRVIVQQVQGRQGQNYSGTMYKGNATSSRGNTTSGLARVVKCYNCQGEGHVARQCAQPKRPRNAAWYKEKAMLAKAQEAGQILDEEQLAFLADLGIPAVLMANISNYGSDVISEVPTFETYLNDMDNQSVHVVQDFEQSPIMDFTDNEISKLLAEQAFWFHILNPTIESSYTPPVIVDVPSELPKVSLVNASLKKLKFHLTQFDSVVKKRTTPNALKEGEWGFEHTKTVFNNEIIPFLKSLKDIFNVFDKDLLNEITEVQIVFDQMDAAAQ